MKGGIMEGKPWRKEERREDGCKEIVTHVEVLFWSVYWLNLLVALTYSRSVLWCFVVPRRALAVEKVHPNLVHMA